MKHILFIVGILISGLLSLSGCKKTEYPDIKVEYSVGQQRGGGIVAYVDANGEHGLICSTEELSTSTNWAGAISLCNDYTGSYYATESYQDWRLPTAQELQNILAATDNNPSFDFENGYFWSSTEVNSTQVTVVSLNTGSISTFYKTTSTPNVRAVRTF
jgi:hypothetical protein